MAHKEGDFVRHRARPEWGVGRIGRLSGDNLEIQFQDHVRLLKTLVAEPHLIEHEPTSIRAHHPRRRQNVQVVHVKRRRGWTAQLPPV